MKKAKKPKIVCQATNRDEDDKSTESQNDSHDCKGKEKPQAEEEEELCRGKRQVMDFLKQKTDKDL